MMLRLVARLSKILGRGSPVRSRPGRPRRRVACEALEPRELLTGLGTDYTLMGGQWDDSKIITYSVAPDGITWAQGVNNVNASLGAEYGGAGWQRLIAQALQTWASVTNLNFMQVGDSSHPFNAPGVNQGDPSFGDIRIGGSNFGTTATIAQTYGPPPNGYTGAGDVGLNTGFNFAPGSHYDLETVLLHELGHSLGLGESPQPTSVMYSNYEGVRQSLSAYDVEGIQSIYGARSADVFQSRNVATAPSTALDLTSSLNPYHWGQLAGLGLQTIGDTEYFSVVAPALSGSTLNVAAIAQGFSLLSPKISIIDPATGATLSTNSNPNAYGNNVLVTISNVQAGHRYLIAVTGASGNAFSVGSYGVQLGFFGGTPVAPPPDAYPYDSPFAQATDLGANTQPTISNLTLPSARDYQLFSFETTKACPVLVSTLGAEVVVINSADQTVARGAGQLGYLAPGAGKYYLVMLAPDGKPVYNYAFAVRTFPNGTGSAGPAAIAPPPVSPSPPSTPMATMVEVVPNDASPPSPSPLILASATPSGPLKKPTRPGR